MAKISQIAGEEQITYDGIRRLFRASCEPVLTASDVAEVFDIARNSARYRLEQMDDVQKKKVGASAVVYWLEPEPDDS